MAHPPARHVRSGPVAAARPQPVLRLRARPRGHAAHADRHGVRKGDILLGLDGFETLNDRNLKFILQDSRVRRLETLSFQIHREGRGALVGHIDLRR